MYVYIYIYIKKFCKNNIIRLLLMQYLMGIPNIAGVNLALYGAWCCDHPGGFQRQSPKSSNYLQMINA